jgi:hypothetical protein
MLHSTHVIRFVVVVVLNDLRCEVVVYSVDIGDIVDHFYLRKESKVVNLRTDNTMAKGTRTNNDILENKLYTEN